VTRFPYFGGEGGDAGGCWSPPQHRSPTKSSSVGPSSQPATQYSAQEKERESVRPRMTLVSHAVFGLREKGGNLREIIIEQLCNRIILQSVSLLSSSLLLPLLLLPIPALLYSARQLLTSGIIFIVMRPPFWRSTTTLLVGRRSSVVWIPMSRCCSRSS
jgi:hypothetical protein